MDITPGMEKGASRFLNDIPEDDVQSDWYVVEVISIDVITTVLNRKMCTAKVRDNTGENTVVMFPSIYARYSDKFCEGTVVRMKAVPDSGPSRLLVECIEPYVVGKFEGVSR
jgi:DNA polymerase III alpha subunit